MASDPHISPIVLPEPVPPAALCTHAASALETDPALGAALWWHGADLAHDAWPTRNGHAPAKPTAPNTRTTTKATHGAEHGLRCETGIHCGFVVPDVAQDARRATLALRWISPPAEDARTLLTLNTGGAHRASETGNYLFLSETGGTLTAKDDAGGPEITLPAAGPDVHLAMLSLAPDRLDLWLDGTHAVSHLSAPLLHGPADLFIAARNQRPGLLKTLGTSLILDVWVWPGAALLADGPHAPLTALRRYHLWAGLGP